MQKTPVWQFKACQNWVKTIMISELVENDEVVAEMFCGTGLDTGKWERAKIGKYVGYGMYHNHSINQKKHRCQTKTNHHSSCVDHPSHVIIDGYYSLSLDPSRENLAEAEIKWKHKKCPYEAEFKQVNLIEESIDPTIIGSTTPIGEDIKMGDGSSGVKEIFGVVSCFDGLQSAFDSVEHATTFIQNVSSRLKNGGYFFGIIPDSSAIWYKSQKVLTGLPAIKSSLFNIEFDSDNFTFYGTKYNLNMKDGTNVNENLIHFPTFINLCKQNNLLFIEASNLSDFYEDNKKNYEAKLKQSGVLSSKGKIEPPQLELIKIDQPQVLQNK
ncbi:hypothetical protein DFA_05698 [Cavenderia fasciculata]|uniref:mRNA (guanine-N(7))-methyltransferase n=1 Tax=Cavenderia fasciculata TaxID=261658 RepID=F4PM65_CACFS|nr:uncharacterized protein DFA_05698 [Cavenderia fasciculata]EGG23565.1 hypothetical protein DFA_05698 [Cavenderia fasciculata]|eukprot:XP_004361416.1 hypothetical protein DFA_05698 [Cavenderia fasciculata]